MKIAVLPGDGIGVEIVAGLDIMIVRELTGGIYWRRCVKRVLRLSSRCGVEV